MSSEYESYGAALVQEEMDRSAQELQQRWEEEQAKIAQAEAEAQQAQQQAALAEQVAQQVQQAKAQQEAAAAQAAQAAQARRTYSPYDDHFRRHLSDPDDDELVSIIAAGTYQESKHNPRAVGDNGASVGLFQMHERGEGRGLTFDQRADPDFASSRMVPAYEAAYRRLKAQGLTGADLAAAVAAEAEKPEGWHLPNGPARQKYREAYQIVTGGQAPGPRSPQGTASYGAAPQAVSAPWEGPDLFTNWVQPDIALPRSIGAPFERLEGGRAPEPGRRLVSERTPRMVDDAPPDGPSDFGNARGVTFPLDGEPFGLGTQPTISQNVDSAFGMLDEARQEARRPSTEDYSQGNYTPPPAPQRPYAGADYTARTLTPDQFDSTLSREEALAACGPAAYVAFARAMNRNPTMREAVDLARRYGWTTGGMSGPDDQTKMLNEQGIPAEMQWIARDEPIPTNRLNQEIAAGRPVILSTPGHYFVITDRNPDGSYHVGASGTAYRGGSPDMTIAQMESIGKGRHGFIYMTGGDVSVARGAPTATDVRGGPDVTRPGAMASEGANGGDWSQAPPPEMFTNWVQPDVQLPTSLYQTAGNRNSPFAATIDENRVSPELQARREEHLGFGAVGAALEGVDFATGSLRGIGRMGEAEEQIRAAALPEWDALMAAIAAHPNTLDHPAVLAAESAYNAKTAEARARIGHFAEGPMAAELALGLMDPTNFIPGRLPARGAQVGRQAERAVAPLISSPYPTSPLTHRYGAGRPSMALPTQAMNAAGDVRVPNAADNFTSGSGRMPTPMLPGGPNAADSFTSGLARPTANLLPGMPPEGAMVTGMQSVNPPFPYAPGGLPPTPPRPPVSPPSISREVVPHVPGEDILRREVDAMMAVQQPLPLVPTELEKLVPNLRHMLPNDPALQNALIRTAERSPELMQQYQRGRIPQQATLEAAGELAAGWTEKDFMRSPLSAMNEVEITALRLTLGNRADDARTLTQTIAERGGVDAMSAVEQVAAMSQIADLGLLQAVTIGQKSTLARAMNALKIDIRTSMRTLGQGGESVTDLKNLVRDRTDVERALGRLNGHGTPQEVAGAETEAREILKRVRERRPRLSTVTDLELESALNDLRRTNNHALQDWERRFREAIGERPGLERYWEVRNPRAPRKPGDPPPWAEGHAGSPPFASDFGERGEHIANILEQMDIAREEFRAGRLSNTTLDVLERKAAELKASEALFQKNWDTASNADLKRALNDLKMTQGDLDWDWDRRFAEALKREKAQEQVALKLLEKWSGGKATMTTDLLKEFVTVMNGGDRIAALRFARGVTDPGWWGAFQTLRYQSMLSSMGTQSLQILGNSLNLTTNMASHLLMAGANTARYRNLADRPTSFAETRPLIAGTGQGAIAAWPEAIDILRYGANPDQMLRLDAPTGFGAEHRTIMGRRIFPGRSAEVANAAMEGPLRLISASDWLVRGMANEGRMAQLATRKAVSEGLTGPAVSERAAFIMQNRDLFPSLGKDADAYALHTVFQEKNAFADWLNHGRLRSKIATALFPFIRTPINVNWQGISELSPFGLARLPGAQRGYSAARDARRGAELASAAIGRDAADSMPGLVASRPIRDPAIEGRGLADLRFGEKLAEEKRDEVVSKAIIGMALVGLGYWLADNGLLTGPLPLNEGERGANPEGWQPWAASAAGHYVGLANLAPWAIPVALGGALRSVVKASGEVDPWALVQVGEMATQQTFLQSLKLYLDSLRNPERRMEPVLEGFASQLVPYGAGGRQIERALGQPARDPHGPLDAMQASVPFLAGNVPPRLNSAGQPDTSQVSGPYAMIAPLRTTRENDQPWRQELRRLQVPLSGIDRPKDMPLEQHYQYREAAGQLTERKLADTIVSRDYRDQRTSDARRRELLQHAISSAREQARSQVGVRSPSTSSLGDRWQTPVIDGHHADEILQGAAEWQRLQSSTQGRQILSQLPAAEVARLRKMHQLRPYLREKREYQQNQQERRGQYQQVDSYGR